MKIIYTTLSKVKNGYCTYFLKLNVFILSIILFQAESINSQVLTAQQIYKKVSDAVVVIYAYDSNNQISKQGSGVVINDRGYVVTNYHVLEGNDRLEIIHNKEIVPYVDIVGIDVEKDILILKIDEKKFPAIKIGDSKNLNIGQRVYAIGSPLGFENTISEGIISGLRSYDETGRNFIQITTSISPGSSGGAIVNDEGELIGISTLTAKEGQNLNFAIPIDDVLGVEISSYSINKAYKDFGLFSKGYEEEEKGNYKEAIKFYSQYLLKFPNDAGALNNRGAAKARLDDYRGAIQDYNRASELKPNDAVIFNNRGNAKSNLKDYMGALEDYTKAIELNPNYTEAYYNRGNERGDLKDSRGAIEDYTKAIEFNPNFAAAYYNRGVERHNIKDEIGAIRDYTKAIELDPNDASAYTNRAISKFILGDMDSSCLDLSKAGELGNDKVYELIRQYCN